MIKTKLNFGIVAILLFGVTPNSEAQEHYTSYGMDNYSGTVATRYQPAEIVDNRFRMFFGSAFSTSTSNNHRASNFNAAFFLLNQQQTHRNHKYRGYETNALSLDLFNAQVEINHKNAVGYSARYNLYRSVDGIPDILSEADFEEFVDNPVVNTPIDYNRLSIQHFAYFEHTFSYGRVIKEDNEHYLKGGGGLKIINGADAGYFYSKSGTMTLTDENSPNTNLNMNDGQFGIAENNQALNNRSSGVGLDLGVVYEFRPEYDSFKYNMDGETGIERYDKNKYKFKVGLSITNVGFVRFEKDTNSFDFQASDVSTNAAAIQENTVFDDPFGMLTGVAQAPGAAPVSTNKTNFNMSLPSMLNAQFDYHIWKGLYASYSGSFPINVPGDPSRTMHVMTHSITPRYEQPRWGISTPFTVKRNGQFNFGVVGRVSTGNISYFAGSHSMSFLFGNRRQYDASFFCGINFSLKHTVPRDRDNDEVSDKMDRCVLDPGPWKYRGCPDTDGDKIIDLEDHCIYDPGPPNTDGCPDRDEDGVIDVNDRCPDVPGHAVHYGCPDRDKDGVIDLADRCPDVPGIELNNGCPFENQGCCMDNDGDGISNAIDECPEISGSVYNKGCPIDSTNFDNISFETIKPIVDPNHTEVQVADTLSKGSVDVDLGKEDDSPVLIENEKDIPIMNDGRQVKRLTVYFDHDQAFMKTNYHDAVNRLLDAYDYKKKKDIVFVVIGHTDSDGTDDYNLRLSRRRAETVKKHLINQGVPWEQIEVYYYGEWQPLHSDNNEEQKKSNRRAEIKVMQK